MKHNYPLQFLLVLLVGLLSAPVVMAQDDPAYPWPRTQGYSYGVLPTNANPDDAMAAYEYWKEKYVTPWGACVGQRVIFDYYKGTTRGDEDRLRSVSEGIGYGMLLAAYAGDRQTFDGLWAYYQSQTNHRGVMDWIIEYNQGNGQCEVVQENGASDAELDAAMALIVASYQWQSDQYLKDAKKMINIIRTHEFDGLILKPGDAFGGASITNPSYFSPAYYRVFSTIDTGYEQFWIDAAAKGYEIIELAGGSTGLVPDWVNGQGQPTPEAAQYEDAGKNFIYDAIRTPLRSGIDYLWHGNEDAKAYCEKISTWLRGKHSDPGNIGSKYATQYTSGHNEGDVIPGFGSTNNTFIGCFGVAQMATDQTSDAGIQDYVDRIYSENVSTYPDEGFYFNATLKAITLFIQTGNFWLPPPDQCDSPELGPERSLCEGAGSGITLDAGVSDRSYVWRRNGVELPNTTKTLDVNEHGSYEVIATDPTGCVRRDKVYVAQAGVEADFTYVNMAGNVEFTSAQQVGVTSYSWTYEGEEFGTEAIANKVFETTGSFDITLSVSNSGYPGCSTVDEITKTIIIGEGEGVAYHDFNGDDVIVWANETGYEPLPKIHCSREDYDAGNPAECPGNPCSLLEATGLGENASTIYSYIGVDFVTPNPEDPSNPSPNVIDIDATPYVRFKIKSTEDVELTVGLKDGSNATSTPGGSVALTAGEWTEVTLDYTDNKEGYNADGDLVPVDFTSIQGIQFNALEKTPDFTGTLTIDWLIVGQATIPAPAFDVKRDELGFPVYEDPDGDEVYTKVPDWTRTINACEGKATLEANSCTASSIEWYSDDVLIGTGPTMEVGPGKYYVHLKNSTGTTIDSVTVTGANVVPNFDYVVEEFGKGIRFYNSSLDADEHVWDYGVAPDDPDAVNWEEGYNYYYEDGVYTACISVTNTSCAITKEYCEDIEITCNAPLSPISGITSAPALVVDDTIKTCADVIQTISIDEDPMASSYGWFGLGTASMGSTNEISKAFAESQMVKIEAYNVCGEKVQDSVYVQVIPEAVASFTIEELEGPSSYAFEATWVGDDATYEWFEGANPLGEGIYLEHTFDVPGDYNVTLVVTNSCGTDEVTESLGCPLPDVSSAEIAGLSSVCAGTECTAYSVTGILNADSYTWSGPGAGDVCAQAGTSADITVSMTGEISVTATNACGTSAPVTYPVTVKPLPQTSAITGEANPSCEQTFVEYSVVNTTGSSYQWTAPDGASISGNGQSAITVDFGTANGNITVTETRNGCVGEIQTLAVELSGCGLAADFESDIQEVCEGEEVVFTNLSTGTTSNTEYLWNFGAGATPATANTAGPHTVIYSGAGARTVSLTVTDGATNTANKANYISVNPLPGNVGTITGPTEVCAGATRTYFISSVSNATSYTWTGPEGSTVSGTGTSVEVTFGSVSGSVTVTPVNACGDGTPKSVAVNVIEAPATSPITGPESPGCNALVEYSVDANTGSSYNWSLPEGAVITSGAGSNAITVRLGTANGEVSVIETNSLGCAGQEVILPVTLTGCDLAANFKASSTSVCEGEAVTFTNLTTGASANATYTWEFGTGASSATKQGPGPHQIIYSGAGSKTVKLTVTDGATVSSNKPDYITVSPLPAAAGTLNGPETVCQGATHTYSISTVSNATDYVWNVPADAQVSGSGTSVSVTFGEISGDVSVTPVNDCGEGQSSSLAVNVQSAPSTSVIDGNSKPECNGTATYTVTGSTGSTYEWSVPQDAVIVGDATGNTITVDFAATNGIVSVVETNAAGCSGQEQSITITLSGCGLAPNFKASKTSICEDATVTFENLSTGTTSNTIYEWNFGTGADPETITGKGPHVVTYSGSGKRTVTLTVTEGDATLTSEKVDYITVNPKPLAAGPISGDLVVCPGSAMVRYTTESVTGATGYEWTVPGDATFAGTGTAIDVNFGTASGAITVAAKNSCGTGPESSVDVTVSPEVKTSAIEGNSNPVCEQQGVVYSVSGNANSTYQWSVPTGAQIVSGAGTNEVTVDFGPYNGTISVVETSEDNCVGEMKTLDVMLSGCNLNAQFEASELISCIGTQVKFTNKSTASLAAEYLWDFGNGVTKQGPGPHTVTYDTEGTYDVSLTITEGSATDTETKSAYITVTDGPSAAGEITGVTTTCSGSTERYSITPVAGATSYEWTVPEGATVDGTGNIVNVTFGSASGTVSVAAKNNCGLGTASSIDVTISNSVAPSATISTPELEVYAGNPVVFTSEVVNGGTDPYYMWYLNDTYKSGGTGRDSYTVTFEEAGEQIVHLVVESSSSCASPSSATSNEIAVNVITPPDGYAYAGLDQEICGTSTNLDGNYPTCNGTGTWSFVEGSGTFLGGATGANNPKVKVIDLAVGTNVLEWTVTSTCGTFTDQVTITVSTPAIEISVSDNIICEGELVEFSADVTNAGNTPSYDWRINGISQGINSPTFSSSTLSEGDIVDCFLTSSVEGCEQLKPSNQVNMSVSPRPSTADAGPDQKTISTTANLEAESYSIGEGVWSTTGSATINNELNRTTQVSNLVMGDNIFTWTISSGVCPSSSDQVTISVGSKPDTKVIDGPDKVEANTEVTYSISGPASNDYEWIVPEGATITSGQGTTSITVSFGNNVTGSVLVKESNDFGTTTSYKPVNSGNSPSTQMISGPSRVEVGGIATYSIDGNDGSEYEWTIPSGAVIQGGGGINDPTITIRFNSGSVGVKVSVTESNEYGSATSEKTVSVGNTPVPETITGPSTVLPNQSYTYSVPDHEGSTYQWSLPEGAVITKGEGTSTVTVLFGSNVDGQISVTESNNHGSATSSLAIRDGSGTVGINDASFASYDLYPNPTREFTVLRINSMKNSFVNIRVVDIKGIQVLETKASTNQDIRLGDRLKAGVYTIQVNHDEYVEHLKFIKVD